MTDDGIVRTASLSKDGAYRFSLHRQFKPGDKRMVWIMLNPSTADATVDDPTIRRCMGYARDWGFDGMTVVNLFPLRATDPAELRKHDEPTAITKLNNSYLESECYWAQPDLVICAWGTHGALGMRNKKTVEKLIGLGVTLHVLRLTEDRHPSHPLYLPKALKPIAWSGR